VRGDRHTAGQWPVDLAYWRYGNGIAILITIILQLLIVAVILGAILWLAGYIPGIGQFLPIIRGVAIILFIIYVLYILMGFVGGGHLGALPR